MNNSDGLHCIAIDNLKNPERQLKRWWHKKYNIPFKNYENYTQEELYVEMLEDYYEDNPEEINKFLDDPGWDGTFNAAQESYIKEKLKKRKPVDISRFQSNEVLTKEQEKKILDDIGKSDSKTLGSDNLEFEDKY